MATKRPDLAAAEYTSTGYLHRIVAPALPVFQQGGTLYYLPASARTTAQKGRASLGEVTAANFAAESKVFACQEIISRKRMGYAEVTQGYSDLLTAELDMAAAGKDEVEAAIETALATELLKTPEDISASANIPGAIEEIASELMDKAPDQEVALILSSKVFTALKSNEEIKARMRNTGIAIGEGGDPRSVTAAQMAAIFGVNQVLVGKTSIWGTTSGVLAMLPHREKAQNQEAQLARVVTYTAEPVDGIPFTCESFEDNTLKGYVVDTIAQASVVILNAALKHSVTILDA